MAGTETKLFFLQGIPKKFFAFYSNERTNGNHTIQEYTIITDMFSNAYCGEFE